MPWLCDSVAGSTRTRFSAHTAVLTAWMCLGPLSEQCGAQEKPRRVLVLSPTTAWCRRMLQLTPTGSLPTCGSSFENTQAFATSDVGHFRPSALFPLSALKPDIDSRLDQRGDCDHVLPRPLPRYPSTIEPPLDHAQPVLVSPIGRRPGDAELPRNCLPEACDPTAPNVASSASSQHSKLRFKHRSKMSW